MATHHTAGMDITAVNTRVAGMPTLRVYKVGDPLTCEHNNGNILRITFTERGASLLLTIIAAAGFSKRSVPHPFPQRAAAIPSRHLGLRDSHVEEILRDVPL